MTYFHKIKEFSYDELYSVEACFKYYSTQNGSMAFLLV